MSEPLVGALLTVAGGLGAVLRFVVDGALAQRYGRGVPWGTLAVNVAGSLVLGLVTGAVLSGAPEELREVVGTGFCGGLTTFSTASLETVRLVQAGRTGVAVLTCGAHLVLGLIAAAAGLALTAP